MIRERHRQSITRPFSYLSHRYWGSGGEKEAATAFPIFSQTFIENEMCTMRTFIIYYKKLRFWSRTKIK